MNEQLLKRTLQSVGMECFVKYYRQFSNASIEPSSIVEDLTRNEGYKETACKTRVSKARAIIDAGKSIDALQMIVDASKVSSNAKTGARDLLLQIK